jgi:hypothetical protein
VDSVALARTPVVAASLAKMPEVEVAASLAKMPEVEECSAVVSLWGDSPWAVSPWAVSPWAVGFLVDSRPKAEVDFSVGSRNNRLVEALASDRTPVEACLARTLAVDYLARTLVHLLVVECLARTQAVVCSVKTPAVACSVRTPVEVSLVAVAEPWASSLKEVASSVSRIQAVVSLARTLVEASLAAVNHKVPLEVAVPSVVVVLLEELLMAQHRSISKSPIRRPSSVMRTSV